MKAMILAAGRGARLRPLTDQQPKPLLSAGGKPLLQWTIESLARNGFSELVINTAWLGRQIESWLGDGHQFGVRVLYSPEPDGALGTGGGIHHALPLLGEQPFLVINGDVWTDYPLTQLDQPRSAQAHLVLVDNPPQHPAGDFELNAGWVGNGVSERLTFAGIGVYHPALFAACAPGEFALAPLLREAAENQTVSGEHFAGEWMDTGTVRRLADLDKRLRGSDPEVNPSS